MHNDRIATCVYIIECPGKNKRSIVDASGMLAPPPDKAALDRESLSEKGREQYLKTLGACFTCKSLTDDVCMCVYVYVCIIIHV